MLKNSIEILLELIVRDKKWIKFYSKDYSYFYLGMSGSTLSACSIQGEENTKKLLGLSLKNDCKQLLRGKNFVTLKTSCLMQKYGDM